MVQKSLVLFKTDAMQRGLVGEILTRFERMGLKLIAAKVVVPSKEVAEQHYPNSKEWKLKVGQNTIDDCIKGGIDLKASVGTEDAFEIGNLVKQWNVDYLSSGPVLAVIFEGSNAIVRIRSHAGPTVPTNAPAGTIRGDYSLDSAISANREGRAIHTVIHASGDPEEAEREIALWFKPEEICAW